MAQPGDQKTICPKQSLQSCFQFRQAGQANQSCLYRRFILGETTGQTPPSHNHSSSIQTKNNKAGPLSMTSSNNASSTSSEFLRQFEPLKQDQIEAPNKGQKYQTRQASEEEEEKNADSAARKAVWKKFTLEDSIAAILVGIAVVFFLSMVSLFIGIYLIYKRKTFVYHAATDSSYPQDER